MTGVLLNIIFGVIRDPFSMWSHLLGLLLSVVALVLLVRRACRCGSGRRAVARLATYGLSMILAFAASTLFHAFIGPPDRLVFFKKLDHAAIFLFMAGTATAVYGALPAPWVPRLLVGIWGVTLGALVVKMVIWPMPLWLTASVYLAIGGVVAVRLQAFIHVAGWGRVRPLLWGGGLFGLGAVMFVTEQPVLWPGVVEGHELFHVLVLIGAAAHFLFIYRHCTHP